MDNDTLPGDETDPVDDAEDELLILDDVAIIIEPGELPHDEVTPPHRLVRDFVGSRLFLGCPG